MISIGLFFFFISFNTIFALQAAINLRSLNVGNTKYHSKFLDNRYYNPKCNAFYESQTQRSFRLGFGTSDIASAFNVATFLPQPFWLLMILVPNSDLTKKLMGSWFSIFSFSLVHLFIVIVSASQEDGTAPIVEFSKVFDPAGNPQQAMLGMMTYPNFVSGIYSDYYVIQHFLTLNFSI